MVPKESRFNQSVAASGMCAHKAWRFPGSIPTMRDGKLVQMPHSCHHVETIRHPNSSYVTTKLYGTSTCGCNNNMIFSKIAILTFPTVDVCRYDARVMSFPHCNTRLTSLRTLMAYFLLPPNGEESFNTFLCPDPDPDPDHLRGGSIHGIIRLV